MRPVPRKPRRVAVWFPFVLSPAEPNAAAPAFSNRLSSHTSAVKAAVVTIRLVAS